jgi:hypothetical protein
MSNNKAAMPVETKEDAQTARLLEFIQRNPEEARKILANLDDDAYDAGSDTDEYAYDSDATQFESDDEREAKQQIEEIKQASSRPRCKSSVCAPHPRNLASKSASNREGYCKLDGCNGKAKTGYCGSHSGMFKRVLKEMRGNKAAAEREMRNRWDAKQDKKANTRKYEVKHRCGALLQNGKTCKKPVSKKGLRCHMHPKKNSKRSRR